MKTTIDINDAALGLAAKKLGTTTKKDTVNAALEFVADRRRRIERLLDDPHDADFERIAATTGQPHSWIAPRGSLD
ncbi:MAG: type II toxin-antitoxin system VapB family antitoxin [Micromonosporaceae bacterium]